MDYTSFTDAELRTAYEAWADIASKPANDDFLNLAIEQMAACAAEAKRRGIAL